MLSVCDQCSPYPWDFLLQTMLYVLARIAHLVKSAAVLTWYAAGAE